MTDFWTAFSAIGATVLLLGATYEYAWKRGYARAKQDLNSDRESKRFAEIYAPLMVHFATCHITTVSARGAPYLQQRLVNAWKLLKKLEISAAAIAIFDKKDFPTLGEVEYGDDFPLEIITRHLRSREQYADEKLILLVSHANRAQYEDRPHERDLTNADLALFEHICKEHKALSSRFVGASQETPSK